MKNMSLIHPWNKWIFLDLYGTKIDFGVDFGVDFGGQERPLIEQIALSS